MNYGIIKTDKGKWQLYQIIKPALGNGESISNKAKRIRRKPLAVFRTHQEAEAALMATIESRTMQAKPRANRTDRGKHLT